MTQRFSSRRAAGYTLLEMVVVVVVIVILLMVALPSYQAHIRKSHRASAESHLMDIAASSSTCSTTGRMPRISRR